MKEKKNTATVIKKEIIGYSDVYDLHIDSEDHSFHVNGVPVHNSPGCASRDGKKYASWDKIPPSDIVPRHFGCRSVIVFNPKDSIQIDKRAGIQYDEEGIPKGKQFTDLKYDDWFKLQPDNIQKAYLGVERQKLFASGKYSISQLVNPKTDRLFTIKELQELKIL